MWSYTNGMHAVTEMSKGIELPSSCGMSAVIAFPQSDPALRTAGSQIGPGGDAGPCGGEPGDSSPDDGYPPHGHPLPSVRGAAEPSDAALCRLSTWHAGGIRTPDPWFRRPVL